MKRNKLILAALGLNLVFAITAFADIRPILPPTPQPTPSGTPALQEAQMTVSVSNYETEATLVITRAMLDRLNAAAQPAKPATVAGAFTSQTIVGGLFLSLAVVFGGVWLARSKGPVSRPAIGIVVLAVIGMGATMAIGNIAPPQRIPLNADIVDKKLLGRYVASGKVKVMIFDRNSRDEVMLVLPKKNETVTTGEE